MGTDTPLAVLSERPRLLYDYFKQLFAQVTNPPLDAIREELVTSMESTIGPERNLLEPEPESCRQINVRYPIIDNDQLAKLRHIGPRQSRVPLGHAADALRPARGRRGARARDGARCRRRRARRSSAGNTILILSDRGVTEKCAPIPSLLATAGVHHHLVREGTRTRCALRPRVGRRARSAPRRAADRLRRRRGQPVPGVRDARRHDPPGHASKASRTRRRRSTTSRRSTRASSR